MKYFLDLRGVEDFTLYTIEDEEKICSGKLSAIGIEGNDPQFSNKMDDYLEEEYGIAPSEWEIG